MLVDVDIPRAELVRLARGLTPAKLARVIGLLDAVELMLALKKLRARRAPCEPGARHQPEGEPSSARRRRRRSRSAGLRRDRDDRRRGALRAAERARAPRRIADRPAGGDDAVRRRGAPQSRARHPRARHVRRDALGVRHRAGVRRRRRHAVVEGVPRRRVRLPRRQGALHLRNRLRGAHGLRAGPLHALPRSALPRGRARSRIAGRPERIDLLRRSRALRARRHARDPRRERARRLAGSRGRVGKRRDRLPLGDPQDREAHGPVPARHRLRHLRLLGDAAARQHLRRRQLRRRRPRRVAHGPARLAGRRWDRACRGGRGAARSRARRARHPGGVPGARAAAGLGGRGVGCRDRLRLDGDAGSRSRGRRGGGGRPALTRSVRAGRGARPRPRVDSATSRRRSSPCSASASRPTTSRPRR